MWSVIWNYRWGLFKDTEKKIRKFPLPQQKLMYLSGDNSQENCVNFINLIKKLSIIFANVGKVMKILY